MLDNPKNGLEMRKLKSCPFCGGEAEINKELPTRVLNSYDCVDKYTLFYISCKKCKASGCLWVGVHKIPDCIKAWNTRYEPPCNGDVPAGNGRLK